jgi:hypothetical protein
MAKTPKGEIIILYDFYDGPLSGLVEYDDTKYWFSLLSESKYVRITKSEYDLHKNDSSDDENSSSSSEEASYGYDYDYEDEKGNLLGDELGVKYYYKVNKAKYGLYRITEPEIWQLYKLHHEFLVNYKDRFVSTTEQKEYFARILAKFDVSDPDIDLDIDVKQLSTPDKLVHIVPRSKIDRYGEGARIMIPV